MQKENRLRDTKNIFKVLSIEELAMKKEISFAKALWQKLSATIYIAVKSQCLFYKMILHSFT